MNPGGDVAIVLKYHNKNIFKRVFLRKKSTVCFTVYFASSYVVASVFLNTSIFI